MRTIKSVIYLTGGLILFNLAACKKADDLNKPILGLEGDTWATTPLDTWLYQNFTQPYNMEVKYRWDATELGINNTLVPPDTAQVRELMNVVKKAWIDIYVAEVNEAFIKKLSPRLYQLVGSLRYNGSTVTLGEAEGGSTVRIFDVNDFSSKDREKVRRVLKTIHHEFTHILNQNINFPFVEFQAITKSGYIGTWNQTSVAEAREEGFISNYAKAAPGEDFAEMVSIMITQGKEGYTEILNSIQSAEAKAAIMQKEDIVVAYLKQVWNIDIYSMMDRCQAALNELIPPPPPAPLQEKLGYGKSYTLAIIDTLATAGMSQAFKDVFSAGSAQLGTYGSGGRYIELLWFYFDAPDTLRMRVQYRNPTSPASIYPADFQYEMNIDNDGMMTLKYLGPPAPSATANNNARSIQNYVKPITEYMENSFQLAWPGGAPAVDPPLIGGFYKAGNPADFFLGELDN